MVVISALAFLAGLPFPIAANVSNPYLAYGIVYVSIPAWAIGTITGAIATFGTRSGNPNELLTRWLGSGLLLLNAGAIGILYLVPFYARA